MPPAMAQNAPRREITSLTAKVSAANFGSFMPPSNLFLRLRAQPECHSTAQHMADVAIYTVLASASCGLGFTASHCQKR
jgi:hypothetical protein